MEGVKKLVARIVANHPDARGEIKRVFADGDHVILHSHWHGLSDNPRGEAVPDIFRLSTARSSSTGT
jgi:predicted SnoaL-like aldol condensation-catalyzing enzyme